MTNDLGRDERILCVHMFVCVRVCYVFAHTRNWSEWLDHAKNVGVNHIGNEYPLKAFEQQCSKVRFAF